MKEGEGSGQYGEDRILKLFFRDKKWGFLVDVGAADGFWNSNSIGLLKRPGWQGILIEPETSQFQELQKRYEGREGITCVQCAIGLEEGESTLHCSKQVSTLKEDLREAAIAQHGVGFHTEQVQVRTLTNVLEEYKLGNRYPIDFMSIDAEGMNYEVWQSLDTKKFSPKLVCIEGKGYAMHGYKQLCQMTGNTFYVREDACPKL